ncbi:uncharacterized protein LOC105847814 [Hydra vulgaris]|uniref:uncharacterized protein LOC105847814 n=1 Tax=Hydra vulgaris TaxID=6087 RepID=UPI000640E5A4|nr:uncharacterized protein LOC105847814 [Hydra vulgaris]
MEIRDLEQPKDDSFNDDGILYEKEQKTKTFSRKLSDTLRMRSYYAEKISRRSSAPNSKKNTDINKENNAQTNQVDIVSTNPIIVGTKKSITSSLQRKLTSKNDDLFKLFDEPQNISTTQPSKDKLSKKSLKMLIGSKTVDEDSVIARNERLLSAPGIIQSKRLQNRHSPRECYETISAASFNTNKFVQNSERNSICLDFETDEDIKQKENLDLEINKRFLFKNETSRTIDKFNLLLIGSKSVGKTALTVRFLTGRYIHEYLSLPAEVYSRKVKWNEQSVGVEITDKDIESLNDEIELNQSSGIMILYSIVDRASFFAAKVLLKHLYDNSITHLYPVLLIGTKRDLSRLRTVSCKEALQVAHCYNCTYTEVSAADNIKVINSFQKLFSEIEKKQIFCEHNNILDSTKEHPVVAL